MSSFEAYRQRVRAQFGAEAMQDAQAHARREYPKESCGLIVSGRYVPCDNVAADPLSDFVIAPEQYLAAKRLGAIEAVVHSHPNGQIYPSELDMQQQIATNVPWIILPLGEAAVIEPVAFGDPLERAPILGRPFVWGVFDCYSLIRDQYQLQYGINLPPVPRADDWVDRGLDLYKDHLKTSGFREISMNEARPGDGFLMRWLGSNQLNHAGLLIENDQIIHHLPNRLSRREPAGIWARGADMWVRHEVLDV
jgi:proteasome lid subunit RPN8/RPN11